ncbi:hypothetical protein C8J57DRAFT_1527024 [Mycena rebaudengoi]|nr:hypothetical protein C8J57DRAFT_1527024 [Mycena rebaudengoi]
MSTQLAPVPIEEKEGREFPSEINTYILSMVEESSASLSVSDFVDMRRNLILVFGPNSLDDIPSFWSRILITPTSNFAIISNQFDCSDNSALHILIRIPSVFPFDTARHDGLSMGDHFTRLIELVTENMACCVHLTIETNDVFLLRFALDILADGRPDALDTSTSDTCLGSVRHSPPFTRLCIASVNTVTPVFMHLSSVQTDAHVAIPDGSAITWSDLVRVLGTSDRVATLVLDGFHVLDEPCALVLCAPLHVQMLEIAFRGRRSLPRAMRYIPFPRLHALKLHVCANDDLRDLLDLSPLLVTITQLHIIGMHPLSRHTADIFRLLHRLRLLDLTRADAGFFAAFCHASNRPRTPGNANYNACPDLQHFLVSGIPLAQLKVVVLDREREGHHNLHTITARNAGFAHSNLAQWFSGRNINLDL